MNYRNSAALTLATFGASLQAQTIIVTAQSQQETVHIVGGASLIDASDFADRLTVSLRDALAFSPGVYTQPRFGQEVRISIRGSGISRGFHMRGLTLLQDGIPINLADDNGDFQEFDPQIFEQIAVYRGGNALRYGGSTLGGAINAVTPTGRTATGLEARIDGGSFNTIRGKAAYGFQTGRGDAYLALTSDQGDGDRDHARRQALRFNGNAGIRLSDQIETRFYATLSHIDQDLPGSLTLAQALLSPKRANAANVAGDQERDIDSIRLQNRTTFAFESGSLSFGGFYNAKQLFHPIFQVVDQKSDDRGFFASADFSSRRVELSLGTNARWGDVAARQYLNVGGKRGAQTLDSRQTARTINSYGELRFKPIDGLALIAGMIHIHGRRAIDNRTNPAAGGHVSYDRLAPKTGLLWQPREEIQLYANYSRSVELPGYIELGQTQIAPFTGFVDLDPQRAWTAEIGTRGRSGIARWDISLYRADIRGELLQFSTSSIIPASTFNAGRTRHQGIEAGLDLDLAGWARLRQVYQFNDFRFRGDAQFGNNRLPVVPKHQYRTELRIGSDSLHIAPNLEWMPTGAWADYANSVKVDGYALFGLAAAADITPGVTIFVDARNLTAKKAVGDISAVVRANAGSAIYYPVERRSVYAGVRARF